MGPKATTTSLTPGTSVRCRYRTGTHATQPWLGYDHQGVVLALDDARAWPGYSDTERSNAVAHLAQHGSSRTPVLYTFGVRWDSDLEAV